MKKMNERKWRKWNEDISNVEEMIMKKEREMNNREEMK